MKKPGPGPAGNLHGSVVSRGVLYSPQREPALLASVPAAPPRRAGSGSSGGQLTKEFLVAALGENSPAGRLLDLTLTRNHLGKPHLLVGGAPGPAVSFSWSAGGWWAALGTSRSWIGLDAASPEEFAGAYPCQRVFGDREWQTAVSLTAGDREEAAALLWSVKEAVVKAQGCGYHFFGPRQVRVEFAGLGEQGPSWRAHLAASFPERVSPWSPGFPAASVRLKEVWLTVAWMTPPGGISSCAP
jgi:hypothetical protein